LLSSLLQEIFIMSTLPELQLLTKSFASLSERSAVTEQSINQVFSTLKEELGTENVMLDNSRLEVVLECIRVLRNVIAGIPKNQIFVANRLISLNFWETLSKFATSVDTTETQLKLSVIRCSIQLLSNLMVGQTEFQLKYITNIFEILHLVIETVIDGKSVNYCCYALLILVKNEEALVSVSDLYSRFASLLSILLKRLNEIFTSNETPDNLMILSIQSLTTNFNILQLLAREDRTSEASLHLLDQPGDLSSPVLDLLASDFTNQTDVLLTTKLGSVDQLQPANILLLTKLLATRASQQPVLQNNKSLVINTLYLLRMVHEASRHGSVPDLDLLPKLSDLEKRQQGDPGQVMDNPTYGFKAYLVQLITNLVWEHKENQSLVGELDGLPLLLDCSQVDARNPLITQWVVLAIRGLTNDHQENQAILAGLRREGAMDGSLLKELGIQLKPS